MEQNTYYTGGYSSSSSSSPSKGFAIASLVFGILGIITWCCGVGIIFAIISMIFGIISLVKAKGGKGMSIAGVILSSLTIIIVFSLIARFVSVFGGFSGLGDFYKDFIDFAENQERYIQEYDEDGTIPDFAYDIESISGGEMTAEDFMDQIVDQYKNQSTGTSSYSYSGAVKVGYNKTAALLL